MTTPGTKSSTTYRADRRRNPANSQKSHAIEMSTTRKADLEASRKRLGLVTEEVWLQHTPSGDFAVVYLEGDDIPGSLSGMRTSEEPFDKWFRDNMLVGSHGFDMSQDMNLDNEHVLSVRIQ